jgi:hypothetical protein
MELAKYFYENSDILNEGEDHGWIVSYNKNGKLVKYKYEDGCPMVTC